MSCFTRRVGAAATTGLLVAGAALLAGGPASGAAAGAEGTAAVTGRVTDGSGHGWPLYAEITVAGVVGTHYTRPGTGEYAIELPAGASYDLTIDPVYPGYPDITRSVEVDADGVVHDVAVPVDEATCTANGYAFTYAADFDDRARPAGWTVVDHNANGVGWVFADPRNRGNRTGGSGGYAIVDSDFYGAGNRPDTSLVSPVVDMSGMDAPVLGFNQDFQYRSGEIADVDLSLDGGTTWTNVLRQTVAAKGPRRTTLPLPQAAGQTAVQVRFHYYNAGFDKWWQLDNISLGERTCDPVDGAYVLGNVTDANTGKGLDDVAVTAGGVSARTGPTAEDEGLGDGFYWMFTTQPGPTEVTAKGGRGYLPSTRQVEVDGVTQVELALRAGQLSVAPSNLASTLELGDTSETQAFTVTNSGTAPVRVRMGEARGDFTLRGPDGQTMTRQELESADGAPLQQHDVPVTLAAVADPTSTPGEDEPAAAPTAEPWRGIANFPQAIMDNRVVSVDGRIYSIGGSDGRLRTAKVWVYDPTTLAWSASEPMPGAFSAMTVGAVGGRIVASSGWSTAGISAKTWVYDPIDGAWVTGADNPMPRASAGQAVLDGRLYAVGGCTTGSCTPTSDDVVAYDPVSDSWETLADYPVAVAYPSCGAVDGLVVCTGGNDGTSATAATYAYDPAKDEWSRVADAPADSWGAANAVANGDLTVVGGIQGGQLTNAAFAYDGDLDAWHSLPNANAPRYRGGAACGFYKIGGAWTGTNADRINEVLPGLEQCAEGGADVAWLSIDRTTADLAPGESATVQVTMRAQVDQPGSYTSAVWFREDTPYAAPSVPVNMTVTPPRSWGLLTGVVRGVGCDSAVAPLPGATVTVDSRSAGWTFTTDEQGSYAYWMDRRHSPLEVFGSKDGYRPEWTSAAIKAGQTTTVDLDLDELAC